MHRVAVVGAGGWGTALAVMLAGRGCKVKLWGRRWEALRRMREEGENRRYLPGVPVPPALELTSDPAEAVAGAQLVLLVVPSHAVRETMRAFRVHLDPSSVLVNCAKGLEEGSLLRLSQVMAEELAGGPAPKVAALSGPSHAEEVGRGLPTVVVVAAAERAVAEYVQDILMGPAFRVYTNPDVVGVELGGALKNVIALATGIVEGLGLGDNTKAALLTRGLAEMARLGVAMGADPLTFAGLAGVGDLVVTCGSMHSRNRRAGIELGRGRSLEEVLSLVGMVVEGVRTTRAALSLAERCGVEMPITREVYRVLFEGQPPGEGVSRLMGRGRTHEVEEVVLQWGNW